MVNQNSEEKNAKVIPLKARKYPRKCPMCGKPEAPEARPFCSRRCANLDLGNWLGEVYRAPSDEPIDEPSGHDDYDPHEE